jgi:hypothetical protein
VAARVNRDASVSCRVPDSDASDRHARAALAGWSGNAVRQHAASGVGRVRHSLRHSRFGRDRSSCRSGSGYGNWRTETAGLIGPRGAQTGRPDVDERHDCRDIGPAYVSSTVCGTASMRDRQVGLGAALAPQCRNATPPLVTASAALVPQRLIAPDDMSPPTQQSPTCLSASASRRSLSSHQFRRSAPDMRGSAQPSTPSETLVIENSRSPLAPPNPIGRQCEQNPLLASRAR